MSRPALPKGMVWIEHPTNSRLVKARCNCDWSTELWLTPEHATLRAQEHARFNSWCYVHRNLTPVGADPVMQDPCTK